MPSLRQELFDLTDQIREFAHEMDKIMRGPSTYERGQRIARLVTELEHQADKARKVAAHYNA